MKEWEVIFYDNETTTVFAESYELFWQVQPMEWVYKFSNGSIVPKGNVKAIINRDAERV